MNIINYFCEQPELSEIPDQCRNPFDNDPHPLAIKASLDLQQRLNNSTEFPANLFEKENGKMFGVLVVAGSDHKIGYLSGFSGMLNKQWVVHGFVPPVFDIEKQQSFLNAGAAQLEKLTGQIDAKINSADRLQVLAQITELEKRQEIEINTLQKQHKNNKELRRKERSEINNNQQQVEILQRLSFLSQQDKRELKKAKLDWDKELSSVRLQFSGRFDNEINLLKIKRKKLSQKLHKKVFENYQLINQSGDIKALTHFFDGNMPAGGAGDCAAPKLIQYAHNNKLKILALAEFWWGASPAQGVRHHGSFYPPCRGKCHPVLPFMLQGLMKADDSFLEIAYKKLVPEIIYEDDSLLVLDKPAGLLSIPGKQQQYSVLSWLKERYPQATGALLVHRLDMATSGLLLAAKHAEVYKDLQQQFISRSIKKRYVAILSKAISEPQMTVDMPLRVDLDDRPRQVVCYEHGKSAVTKVKVISSTVNSSRVYFYPLTGRTHQLRVHAAHSKGLNAPMMGDELYGSRSERLFLHAEKLTFKHPLSGELIDVKSKVPF